MKTIHSLVEYIQTKVKQKYNDPNVRNQIAWLILTATTRKTRAELLIKKELSLSVEQQKQIDTWIDNHIQQNMPLQYLIGSVPFGPLDILVEPPILIPRPETEEWVFKLIKNLQKLDDKNINILDIGAGTGCISLALAHELPESHVYAIDISDEALTLSKKNAAHNNIENVTFIQSETFSSLEKNILFDVIVSNPPYITKQEFKDVHADVKEWEDHTALLGGNDGLDVLRKIIKDAHLFLKENNELKYLNLPQLVLEIGYNQGQDVQMLLQNAKFKHIEIHQDLEGRDRVVSSGL